MAHSADTGLSFWATGSGILITKNGGGRRHVFPGLKSKEDVERKHGQSLISFAHFDEICFSFEGTTDGVEIKRFQEPCDTPEKEGSIFSGGKMGFPQIGTDEGSSRIQSLRPNLTVHMKQYLSRKKLLVER